MAKAKSKTHLAVLGPAQSHHIKKWLTALADAGLQVSLLSFKSPSEKIPGVESYLLTPSFNKTGEHRFIDFFGSSKSIRTLLEQIDADVLLASYATNYGFLGVRTGFHPVILQTWTADWTLYPWQGWKQYFFRPLVRHVLRKADLIITDGPALAEIGKNRFPEIADKVVPTTWGIQLADFSSTPELRKKAREKWAIPSPAPLVSSVRGVDPMWYRPESTLPGLILLLETRPDVFVLVLTLNHDRTPESAEHLKILEAHPRARVADRFLSKEEMREIWAMTDVFLSLPNNDGISESVLEGMYAGAIPVVSDVPSNRSFLVEEENAIFIEQIDAAGVHQTLIRVVEELPQLKERLPANNRDWVINNATIEATAEQVAGLVRLLSS